MLWKMMSGACAFAALVILGGYGVAAVIGLWSDGVVNPELVGEQVAPIIIGLALGLMALVMVKWVVTPPGKRSERHTRPRKTSTLR
jgi:uncharacterized membrane protein